MLRLLIVEDDETLALGAQYALEKENFNVDVAKNVRSAMEMAKANQYSLVILDLKLPDGSGYDFCREIRKTSDVPIIFLTACDDEVNIVMGLDLGADDYMTKPFRIKELISRIKAVLRRKGDALAVVPGLIVSGDLTLNTLEGRLYKNGSDILLTATEYKLILLFITNPRKILSRNIILSGIWDVNADFVDDNSLSVNIKRLRQKIEDDDKKPSYITTVRGIGYRWEKDIWRKSQ